MPRCLPDPAAFEPTTGLRVIVVGDATDAMDQSFGALKNRKDPLGRAIERKRIIVGSGDANDSDTTRISSDRLEQAVVEAIGQDRVVQVVTTAAVTTALTATVPADCFTFTRGPARNGGENAVHGLNEWVLQATATRRAEDQTRLRAEEAVKVTVSEPAAAGTSFPVTLTSTTEATAVTITGAVLKVSQGTITGWPDGIELLPGSSQTIALQLSPGAADARPYRLEIHAMAAVVDPANPSAEPERFPLSATVDFSLPTPGSEDERVGTSGVSSTASGRDSSSRLLLILVAVAAVAVVALGGLAFAAGRGLTSAGRAGKVPTPRPADDLRPPPPTQPLPPPAVPPVDPVSSGPLRPVGSRPGAWSAFVGTDATPPFIPPLPPVPAEPPAGIEADRIGVGTIWAADAPGMLAMGLWTEKIAGKGEDAEPSFCFDPERNVGFVATYDGMGGAGSATVRRAADGQEYSGAFVAARLARVVTERFFRERAHLLREPSALVDGLHGELTARFAAELSRCLPPSNRISGSLRRHLPTTLAAVAFEARSDGMLTAVSMWAGDSRTHLLTPRRGLQQLTRDDTRSGDALSLLINDAPMTNVIGADRPFVINRSAFRLPAPAVLVTATDGCFGYVTTPAHYELLLLRALQRAHDIRDWARLMTEELAGFTSDDASLALVAIGYRDFAELQLAFGPRAQRLETEHAAPFRGVGTDDFVRFASLRSESWVRYRGAYEQLLPPTRRPAAPPTADGTRPLSSPSRSVPGPAAPADHRGEVPPDSPEVSP